MATPTVTNLLAFLRGLRRMELIVGPEQETLFLKAFALLPLESPATVCAGLRATIVRTVEEGQLFDVAWQQFLLWLENPLPPPVSTNTLTANVARIRQAKHRHPQVIWMGSDTDRRKGEAEDGQTGETPILHAGASAQERLREVDFARLTEREQQQISRLIRQLSVPRLLSWRHRSQRRGRHVDMHRALRRAALYGDPLPLPRRQRRTRSRPVVLLCDVSGSMDPYSRLYLRFAHALLRGGTDLEVFAFSTRLTRITGSLRQHDADHALAGVAEQTVDFAGGTRVVDALQTFSTQWARRVLRRKAILLLATDGFETGDANPLTAEVLRLSRLARHLFWLNPLASSPDYRPVTTGARVLYKGTGQMLPAASLRELEAAWSRVVIAHCQPESYTTGTSSAVWSPASPER
ncbi:MAG: VWA domain-containing protein [Firmicutes bacterium]|nr:VWA domain-containing protein [Bacillota bacterium]